MVRVGHPASHTCLHFQSLLTLFFRFTEALFYRPNLLGSVFGYRFLRSCYNSIDHDCWFQFDSIKAHNFRFSMRSFSNFLDISSESCLALCIEWWQMLLPLYLTFTWLCLDPCLLYFFGYIELCFGIGNKGFLHMDPNQPLLVQSVKISIYSMSS